MLLFVKKNLQNSSFSLKEIQSLLEILNKKYKIIDDHKYALIQIPSLQEEEKKFLKKRIAYNKEIGVVLMKGDETTYVPHYPLKLLPCKNIQHILKRMEKNGFLLDRNSKRVAKCEKNLVYEVIKEVKEKEFEERKPHNKPGFMPFSLHPRLSKALYNIAQIKENEMVLDPFCGIAGIIIEGEIMNINTICLEKYKKVCEKAFVNLKYYLKKSHNLVMGDATNMPFKDEVFDGIISDLPYGRSTKIDKSNNIYEKFLEEAKRVVKKKRKILIIIDKENFEKEYDIKVEYKTSFYIHKSLTRWLYLLST